MDEMSVPPDRLQVVLELLENHEEKLLQLSEAQEEDRRRRVKRAHDVILNHGWERGYEERSSETDTSQ